MLKSIAAIIGFALGIGTTHHFDRTANASAPRSNQAASFVCRISGHIGGETVAIGIGAEVLAGRGYLTCVNARTGHIRRMPVALRLVGGGVGLDFNLLDDVYLISEDISVNEPSSLLRAFALRASQGENLKNAGLGFERALQAIEGETRSSFEIALSGPGLNASTEHLLGSALIVQHF